ncbi:ATP-binding sensor histidine kinase [Nostoc sp. FACHB-280]|uniref:trifunctional serine/threonine-protein kinase/ATP-binding protein/sensor histidine kinase n=1 Tax=Nostoc sp. FACHB-280 TaxID=2692839 RepID=UPI00168BEF0D|nr:ATP-binding sensor histidine kinase [Nostoc sp. FACHB-280]MBD2493339.1 AAA family ATPase [Nostoc sp. FACHB-280]
MNTPVDITAKIPGYQLTEQLYAGSRTVVYRGIRAADDQPVVIKLLNREYPTFSELLQFQNQYTITKELDFSGIVRPLSLDIYRNGYAFVMEDFGGLSLREYLKNQKLTLQEFLIIALQMCDILHYLYQNRVIHKDIKPANILINPKNHEIKLIDFSIASLLPKETPTLISPNILEGTLAYLSPEQTGRMNRGIDYRSDFYALGVTFFELLTGELPFNSEDPMELVHCHIAKMPTSLEGRREEIPKALSDIVMKLMAKNAEDRYQSALGLKHDLEICLSHLQATGKIVNFEIAEWDICDRFIIPEKLYGRETEVEEILAAFERVATIQDSSNFRSELVLVAGFSGIGKTAVVNEVHKPIVRQRSYFIKGKFDQFNRNIPFSAFVQSLSDLIRQLLTETDQQLQKWQAKILQALGENGQLIVDVIPELVKIIGQQPPVQELSGTAAQYRFNLLLQKFIQIFATKEHPLVIFLDDLQWADLASLQLIKLLMSEVASNYLLLIGAYRDNEVFPGHPLMLTLEEINKSNSIINTISLQPLSEANLNRLVADTLGCKAESSLPLAHLIYQKTQGNPFFSTQFLKALHQDGLIHFDFNKGLWQCDITQISQRSLTDDVVEFMAMQLQKLPTSTQEVLQLAACIGNKFDLKTLGIVCQKTDPEAAADLWPALQAGLILPQSEVYKFYVGQENQNLTEQDAEFVTYKFLHDRVQQAAYSLIPDEQKQATHLQIGRFLLQDISNEQQEESIFAIVGQLNLGQSLITDINEKLLLAECNLKASQKALLATAYTSALDYAQHGLNLLSESAWNEQYLLTLNLHNLAAEAAYLSGNIDAMDSYAQEIQQNAQTLIDTAKITEVKLEAYTNQGQFVFAINMALDLLNQLGINLPKQPVPEEISAAFQAIATQLNGRSVSELLTLPPMTDAIALVAMRILVKVGAATYACQPELFPLVTLKQLELSLQYGNANTSVSGYVGYGLLLCGVLEDFSTGYEFGQLALNLCEQFNEQEFYGRTLVLANFYITFCTHHLQQTLAPLQEGYNRSLEVGDLVFAGFAGFTYCANSYFTGQSLNDLIQNINTYSQGIQQIHQQTALNFIKTYQQTILNLLGNAANPIVLTGEAMDETSMSEILLQLGDQAGLWLLLTNKVYLCFLFGEYSQALDVAQQAKQFLGGGAGTFSVTLLYFYESLALLATSGDAEMIAANQQMLWKRALAAPMNFQHKYDLIQAEQHRVLGQKLEAMELYDRAIAGAKANDYIQEEALANELAAKFYLDWGKETVAQAYMQQAYYCYAHWGAKAKTDDLEIKYPYLLQHILQQRTLNLNPQETISNATIATYTSQASTSNSGSFSHSLDLAAILKASRVLLSAIKLEELITNLMQVLLQNSGAQKIALILPENADWVVTSVATIDDVEQSVFSPHDLDSSHDVPIKMIYAVKHTLQPVIIHNITKEKTWTTDSYIQQSLPKSIVCHPIVNQAKLVGILYLENSLTSEVFTSDRIEIINLLCTQAAIALENARLYRDAQNYAQQLEQSLAQQQASQAQFRNLADNIPGVVYKFRLAPDGSISVPYISSGCYELYGVNPEDVMAGRQTLYTLHHPEDDPLIAQAIAESAQNLTPFEREWRIILPSGTVKWIQSNARPELQADGGMMWDGVVIDVSDRKLAEAELKQKSQELKQALSNLQQAQIQMVQSEKMSALGNLVAGVAHEMNNPLGFIVASLKQVKPTLVDIFTHLKLYQNSFPDANTEILDHAKVIDLEYSLEDLPQIIDAMVIACDRLKNISTSLRTFSRADKDYKVRFNLHEGIDSTILILKHRLKANNQRPAIEVINNYGDLPQVNCFPGQLNQVFMNILANAIDALEEASIGKNFKEIQSQPNCITITTSIIDKYVKISIADNGKGMSEEIRQKIFDHLFTTKAVGKGTGLGLAIARQIIEEKHGGEITVNSVVGTGTEFIITLPIA